MRGGTAAAPGCVPYQRCRAVYISTTSFPAATGTVNLSRFASSRDTGIDDFAFHDRQLYWRCHGRFSDSVVSGSKLEKALSQATTIRKVTTVEKLAKRLAGPRQSLRP